MFNYLLSKRNDNPNLSVRITLQYNQGYDINEYDRHSQAWIVVSKALLGEWSTCLYVLYYIIYKICDYCVNLHYMIVLTYICATIDYCVIVEHFCSFCCVHGLVYFNIHLECPLISVCMCWLLVWYVITWSVGNPKCV